jgi:hypothetical protein
MLTGTALVLATWAFCIACLIILGLPLGLIKIGSLSAGRVRRSLWLGLLLVTVVLLGLSLIQPLASAAVLAVVAASVVAMGVISILMGLRLGPRTREGLRGSARLAWFTLVAAGVFVASFLAAAALGSVTNYDTGLYHLGAIRYAADYATIPGLANLFNPFGYDNSQFVLGAFLGNGPWDGNGYRLLNGLFVVLLLSDLCLRFTRASRKPGDFVLLIGAGLALVPLVGLADYLVTSPTADTAVMLLTLISAAYLSDAAVAKSRFAADSSVAIATAVMAFFMRPTMIVFLVLVLLVVSFLFVRRAPKSIGGWVPIGLVGAVSLLGVAVQVVRNYLLSGWLFYPLSLHGFDVPWRTLDPAINRGMTLAVARDPIDYVDAAQGWSWVGPWIRRLPEQWETFEILLAAVIVIVCLLSARGGRPLRLRLLTLIMAPAAVSVVFWWILTPPSFRFAWGPIFALAAVPAGWFLWRAQRGSALPRGAPMLLAGVLVLLVAYCALARLHVDERTAQGDFRLGFLQVPYSLTAVPLAPTTEKILKTGVRILIPTESDQCWATYPMCTYFTDTEISYRGNGLADGFLP